MGNKEQAVVVIRKDGPCCKIRLSAPWMKRLGWNPEDHVHLAVVDGALVVTRIPLPSSGDLRRKVEASSSQARSDGSNHAQPAPGGVPKGKLAV